MGSYHGGADVELGTALTRAVLDGFAVLIGVALCFGPPPPVVEATDTRVRWIYAAALIFLGVFLGVGRLLKSSRLLMIGDLLGVCECSWLVAVLVGPVMSGGVSPTQIVLWVFPGLVFAIQGVLRLLWK